MKYPSLDDKNYGKGSRSKVSVQNDSDSSGNNVKVSVNAQRSQVTVNGGGPTASLKRVTKPINSSIIFLGDCEMPITKSVTRKNSGSDSSAHKIADLKSKEIIKNKIPIAVRPNAELKQRFAASSQQSR